jgi:hypothetical protein
MTRSRDVADTQDNLGGAVAPFVGAKNRIINGDFSQWQRGSSITVPSGWGYGADRFRTFSYSTNTSTISRQAFTPGTAPVAGYESQFFGRFNSTTNINAFGTVIEDVRTFAGQTVTLSFWAKSASSQTLGAIYIAQIFGTGGSSAVFVNLTPPSLTTSWARYSFTTTLPSLSGKTIGDSNFLAITLEGAINNALDLWGVQLEAGSVATPFTPAGGGFPGAELALCQRYYYRSTGLDGNSAHNFVGVSQSATEVYGNFTIPVTLRAASTTIDFSGVRLVNYGTAAYGISSMSAVESNANVIKLYIITSSSMTTNRTLFMYAAGTPNYLGISAEL